ncbi:Arylsulfatase [Posidoniimonas polymericola]|uniref:Arylsulfatase n=1 Tax=Posidoniimonas polymericola TaxID=2528002 RepID=A0A5C5YSR2_9BACT|nr:sulfatase-like hydrolase/transferase [Posidoniimonas polymericola]TWT77800.1 Arylsulfatase [Posidoniimonas polymericola]
MKLATAVLLVLAAAVPAGAADKPNILFLLTDDQAYDAVHALGWQELQTPHLDRLVHEGVTFTHAYNPGSWSGAVCVASRTMLFTGQMLWRAKRDQRFLEARYVEPARSWPQRMQAAGYHTCMTGKWHVQVDPHRVFDDVRHVRPGMAGARPAMYDRPLADRPDPFDPADPALGGYWKGGRHWSEVVADDAVAMIEESAGGDRPFFLYAAFNAPHDPRQSPAEYLAMYPPDQMDVPASFLPEYPDAEAIGAGRGLRDERLAPFPRTEHAVRVHRAEYAALISHLDAQIGRILASLGELGLRESTYIVFTSDHGLAIGRHGLMGKQSMYEHSLRPPLVVAGPGMPAGERVSQRVYMQDVVPTTLELAGADSQGTGFQSLLPLIGGQEAGDAEPAGREAIYGSYLDRQRAILVGPWKLIVYPQVPRFLLFNLDDDPEEMTDLSDRAELRPVVERLFRRLEEEQRRLEDPLELTPPSW